MHSIYSFFWGLYTRDVDNFFFNFQQTTFKDKILFRFNVSLSIRLFTRTRHDYGSSDTKVLRDALTLKENGLRVDMTYTEFK